VVAVLEDHTNPAPSTVVTKLSLIDTKSKSISILSEGADFYNSPRFSPNGSTLAWTQWDHPDMPWEGGCVYVAPVVTSRSESGEVEVKLGSLSHVAGASGQIAANYPVWTPAGASLHFLSDESGFSNPWIWSIQSGPRPALHAPIKEEFGGPAWHLDETYAAWLDEDKILVVAQRGGRSVLYVVQNGVAEEVSAPFTNVHAVRRLGEGQVVFVGKTASAASAVVLARFGVDDKAAVAASFPTFETLRGTDSADSAFKPELLSTPESITFEGPNGPVHVIYWPPHNSVYAGSDKDEKPPCVFSAHGGPTGQADASLNGTVQFFTSRGWGWVNLLFYVPTS
jgi:dipeptidyl aminopeptidase/acylaminoacyl peptidase